jgi:hypothetical protein
MDTLTLSHAELVTLARQQQSALTDLTATVTTLQAVRRPLMAELLTVCRRIAKQIEHLFVLVLDPAAPATNNATERSLRHPWP